MMTPELMGGVQSIGDLSGLIDRSAASPIVGSAAVCCCSLTRLAADS